MSSASTISNLLDASAAANGFSAAGKKDAAKELNDRFLKLLVAQMKNQDPLNPLDNAQVTSQMAQINTVTGINGLNETVGKLLEQFGAMEALQASQLTGRNVLVTGNTMTMDAQGTAAVGGVELTSAASSVKVEIRDGSGALMRSIDLGKADAGVTRFTWDGKTDAGVQVAAGNYTVNVVAKAGTTEVPGTPLMMRKVEAVTRVDGSTQLVLAGGTRIAYGDVKQIL